MRYVKVKIFGKFLALKTFPHIILILNNFKGVRFEGDIEDITILKSSAKLELIKSALKPEVLCGFQKKGHEVEVI